MTSTFVTSSASLNLLCWNVPIGWPNALRSLAYSMVSWRIWAAFAVLETARADPLLRQPLHHRDEAHALVAEPVGVGDPDVLEEQLGGVGLVLPDLVELAAAAEARHAGLDDEQA